ncbi:substrate-binding domain-containing protein [Salinivibrio sp. IB872]|uniref:substrate-binding domain-containing protein n=1 Tax=Salinivibrio sp. IB872 TaxID=1766123 RepID=UPI0009C72246|nr:hypothetical protein BZJ18_10325 [Salinivibrio sp. IB872]
MLSYIDRLLRLNNETLSALSAEPLRGPVHFGIPTDYAHPFLKQFIPRIREAFPELVPRITCGRSRKLRELVTTGDLDVAIVTGEPQFVREKSLWSEALCWYAPAGLPINTVEALPVALLESDCALRDLAASDLRQSGLDYHAVLTSSDMANLYSEVESGLAVALLPESSITSSKVRPFQIDQLPGQRLLTMNIIDAGTLSPNFMQPLQRCVVSAARALTVG